MRKNTALLLLAAALGAAVLSGCTLLADTKLDPARLFVKKIREVETPAEARGVLESVRFDVGFAEDFYEARCRSGDIDECTCTDLRAIRRQLGSSGINFDEHILAWERDLALVSNDGVTEDMVDEKFRSACENELRAVGSSLFRYLIRSVIVTPGCRQDVEKATEKADAATAK